MSDKKKKGDKSARSDKETPRPEKALKDEPVERGVHTLPDEDIETKAKAITLPPGGSFVFRCLEVKDMKHKEICYKVIVDGEDKYHTKPAKGDKFVDEALMEFSLKVETKTVAVELDSKGLIGNNYVGEVRFDISELLSGYPFDKWYDLQNKVGKEGKKKPQGKVHIQVMYLAPGTKQSHDEFTKPLISLIAKDRLDLFPKKIEDLGGKGNVSDKTADKDALTPLLFAAREGKAGFCKLLVENGANLATEVDRDGLTCIHFAAANGHFSVLRYLLKQKGAPLNAQDNTAFKNTPLHAAAAANMGESVAILIQAGADFHHLNGKKEAPLHHALIQQAGAPKAVFELVKGGADVYQKNAEGLAVWEVAQRKDLCSSSQTRSHFMKACNVVDPREFALQQKLPTKQRIEGEGLSPDWTTANQFIVTSKKTVEVTCLLYPIMANRPEDYAKALGFCVIKDKEPIHNLPSFQPEGIGFGGSEAFKFVVEPEDCYAVCPFVTDQALSGQFGLCFFQKEGNDDLKITCGKKWKHTTSLAAAWKGDNACGSALPAALKNTSYVLSCDSEKEVDCYVMVAQKTKDVSAIVFDDNRIVPAKFYIGLFVYTEDKKKELVKSSKWHNSKEVYVKCRVGGAYRSVLVFPCTLQAGEELDYELSAWCDVKVSLKKNK